MLFFVFLLSFSVVRVKGGMHLRNGMRHGLQNDIIMRDVIYAECSKKWMKLKSAPFLRQSICKSSRFFNVAGSTTMRFKKPRRTPDRRSALFVQPKRFYLPLLVGLHGSTDTTSRKSSTEEKGVLFWKVTLPSAALIFFNVCKRCLQPRLTSQVF